MDPDIVCLQEIHLKGNNVINFGNYKWFGLNRPLQKKTLKRGSGGIGILVKDHIFEIFNVTVIKRNTDSILGVKFVSVTSEYSFVLFCCYLPPDGSLYSNPDSFYSELICSIYLQ